MPKRGPVQKEEVLADTIRMEIIIPLMNGPKTAIAGDAVARTTIALRKLLSSDLLACAKEVYLECAYTWALTADGTIGLYDYTAAGDVTGSTLSFTGGESSERARTSDFLANITAGREFSASVNVTTAGGGGETIDLNDCYLVVVLGVS